jgi:transposase
MQTPHELSRSLTVMKQDSALIAVIEMSLSSWLVGGIVPGIERQPLKKLAVDESALPKLLNRWREEAETAGRKIKLRSPGVLWRMLLRRSRMSLEWVVGPDLVPMDVREGVVSQRLGHAALNEIARGTHLGGPQVVDDRFTQGARSPEIDSHSGA